jgi:uncharacterized protein YwbE
MAGWPSEDELIIGAILATDSERATTEMSRTAAWHSLARLVGSQHSRLWESRGNSTRGGINAVLAADALGAHDEVTQTRKAARLLGQSDGHPHGIRQSGPPGLDLP